MRIALFDLKYVILMTNVQTAFYFSVLYHSSMYIVKHTIYFLVSMNKLATVLPAVIIFARSISIKQLITHQVSTYLLKLITILLGLLGGILADVLFTKQSWY